MKAVTVLLIAVMLMCCNVKSNSKDSFGGGLFGGEYYISGMHYSVQGNSNSRVVINITKDSLECEYYRKQLNK